MPRITIDLTADQVAYLNVLRSSSAMGDDAPLDRVVKYILASVADGVRRPGSWEAQLLPPMFGQINDSKYLEAVLEGDRL